MEIKKKKEQIFRNIIRRLTICVIEAPEGEGERPVQKNIFEEMTEKFPGLTEAIHVQI